MKIKLLLTMLLLMLGPPLFAQQTSGTLSITTGGADCTTATNCAQLLVAPVAASASITLTGTWTGTANFEITTDSVPTNWVSLSCVPTGSSTAVTSATANGVWLCAAANVTSIRVRDSAGMTGTTSVLIRASQAAPSARLGTGGGATAFSALTSGTNTTGALVIGTGASLSTSGSGTIAATSVAATQYYPLAGNASSLSAPYPTNLVTNSNSGTDFCQRQFNVAAVTVGGNQITTIDARGEEVNETAAAMTCASGQNPFPVTSLFGGSSTLQGDLFLEPPGLITLIAPWQIGQNQVRMVGTNWGSSAASAKGTTLQASGSFVIPGLNSGNGTAVTLYNPGLFTIGAGYGYASNGLGPYASDSSYFVTDANSQPGVVPFIFGSGQEGTRASEFTALNGCATILDEGLGSQSISDGGGLNNFNLSYSAAATCPAVNTVAATISAWTVVQSGSNFIAVVTYNNSPTVTPTPGMQVVVATTATGAHYNVNTPAVVGAKICAVSGNSIANSGNWSDLRCEGIASLFSATKQFAYLVNQSQTDTAGAAGTANFFGVMGRYDVAKGGSREWSNGTMTGNQAPQAPIIAMSISGSMDQTFRNLHLEACTACAEVGDDGATSGAYLEEITTTTSTTDGVYFSNAWGSVKNSWIMKLATVGTTSPLVDVQNGNTLTAANNPSLNLYSLDNAGYPFTFANPAAGVEIANGFDFYNGTFGIYNTGVLKSKMDSSGNIAGLALSVGAVGSTTGNLSLVGSTSGIAHVAVGATGVLTLQPGADSTAAILLENAAGTIGATFDTTNSRLRIGDATPPNAVLDIVGKFTVSSSGVCSAVAGFTAAGAGGTGCVGDFTLAAGNQTTLGADLAATTLVATGAAGANLYRVSVYTAVTRAATTSSTLPTACVLWTDRDNSTTLQVLATASSTLNTLSAFAQASVVIDAKASTNIQVATGASCTNGTGFASVGGTTMQYKVRARVEAI